MLNSCSRYERECHNGCGVTFTLPPPHARLNTSTGLAKNDDAGEADACVSPEKHYSECPLELVDCVFVKVRSLLGPCRWVMRGEGSHGAQVLCHGLCIYGVQFGCDVRVQRKQQDDHNAQVQPSTSMILLLLSPAVLDSTPGCLRVTVQAARRHESLCSSALIKLQEQLQNLNTVGARRSKLYRGYSVLCIERRLYNDPRCTRMAGRGADQSAVTVSASQEPTRQVQATHLFYVSAHSYLCLHVNDDGAAARSSPSRPPGAGFHAPSPAAPTHPSQHGCRGEGA